MNADDNQLETDAFRHAAGPAAGNRTRRDGSFPLIALLQLAAFSAALVACIDGRELVEALDRFSLRFTLIAVNMSVILGFAVVAFGFAHLRSWRTALAAGAMGALHSPAILAAFVAPAPFWRAGPAVAVLLLSTIVLRIRSA